MLIRRHDAAMRALRPFALPRPAAHGSQILREGLDAADVAPDDALGDELARLQARIETLEAALDDAASARMTELEAALEQGREEGRKAADELGSERLEALRSQLAKASQECLMQLSKQGDIAIEIARAAIHKILGEASPRAALTEEIVLNAMAQVAAGTVVAVRVSGKDFDGQEELASLARDLGAVRIARDADLPAGGCEIELTLGKVDGSLDVQLASLDRELDRCRTWVS